jgi:hypothetical protein
MLSFVVVFRELSTGNLVTFRVKAVSEFSAHDAGRRALAAAHPNDFNEDAWTFFSCTRCEP